MQVILADTRQGYPVIEATVGLMAFHDGRPVECLHRLRETRDGDVWLVKPLFVENPVTREEIFRRGDRLTPLHTHFR